nr:activity-regulated cytoskeleton associated protein 1 [Helicoverpa armigera]
MDLGILQWLKHSYQPSYKKIEAISNDNAIEGLTLLLIWEASIWWLGVKDTIMSWQEAVSLIRSTFAPKRRPYLVYDEIVCDKQQSPVGTELFVAKKRALMAELPKPSLTPSQGLDLLYTSLHISIRDRIPRDSIATFEDFFSKVRQLEESVAARSMSSNISASSAGLRHRCTFCHAYGHNEQECPTKAGKDKNASTNSTSTPAASKPTPGHKITCYGCGEPGVVRS